MPAKLFSIKKIVLMGEARVGKTSLVRRYVTGYFNPAYQITLGTTIMKKEVEYIDQIISLSIWDVGGQEVFKQIRTKYFYGSSGALAVCDAANRKSFERLPEWVDSFRAIVGEKPIMFLANKVDLKNLEVTTEDMEELTRKYKNSNYMFTSAKEGINVEVAFYNLVRMMIEKEEPI